MNRSAEKLWQAYQVASGINEEYTAFAFGDSKEMADESAQYVLEGKKKATASLAIAYEIEDEPLPQVGDYNVILNGEDEAVCIIRILHVSIVPFNEVSEKHAYFEGEGDQSLDYWRREHEAFFKRKCEEASVMFDETTLIVLEEFECLYDFNFSSI